MSNYFRGFGQKICDWIFVFMIFIFCLYIDISLYLEMKNIDQNHFLSIFKAGGKVEQAQIKKGTKNKNLYDLQFAQKPFINFTKIKIKIYKI